VPGPAWIAAGDASADNRWTLVAQWDGLATIADRDTGQRTDLDLRVHGVQQLAFSPDAARFAIASDDGYGKLFDAGTHRELGQLAGFTAGVFSVAFAPDGRRLALGSSGREAVKLWDPDLGLAQELLTLEGSGTLFGVSAFSPDGNVLGSLSAEGTLHVWIAPSRDEILAGD
jgi:WD40 repeat protein